MDAINKFRDKFRAQFENSSKNTDFDPRDIARLYGDAVYANSFLTWKKNNIDDSVKLACEVFEWRRKNNVTDLSLRDFGNDFYLKKSVFCYGKDKEGNRILYFIGKRFVKSDEAQAKKLFIYLLERLQRDDPSSSITFVLDAGDCGMNNVDLGLIKLLVDCFMSYFPHLLGRTFVVDLPGLLTAVWNIVKVWFNEEMKSRTSLCSKKDLKKFVSSDQLPTILGGESTWEPSSDPAEDILAGFAKDDDNFTDAVENLQISNG